MRDGSGGHCQPQGFSRVGKVVVILLQFHKVVVLVLCT